MCVSDVLEFFEVKPPGKCKPACTEFYFKPVTTQVFYSIFIIIFHYLLNTKLFQYIRVSEKRNQDVHRFLNISNDIEIASMVLKLSDEVKVIFQEQPKYSRSELLANMGGTAGLVLGLSVLSILQMMDSILTYTVRSVKDYYKRRIEAASEIVTNVNTNETMMKYM